MLRFAKWAAPIAALSLLMVFTLSVRAEDKKETGTITGTLVDKAGKAVANAEVELTKHKVKAPVADTKPKENAAKPEKVFSKATTDNDGKFTIADVPAGEYSVSVNVKGQGRAAQKITVKAGETTTVELKLGETGKKAKE